MNLVPQYNQQALGFQGQGDCPFQLGCMPEGYPISKSINNPFIHAQNQDLGQSMLLQRAGNLRNLPESALESQMMAMTAHLAPLGTLPEDQGYIRALQNIQERRRRDDDFEEDLLASTYCNQHHNRNGRTPQRPAQNKFRDGLTGRARPAHSKDGVGRRKGSAMNPALPGRPGLDLGGGHLVVESTSRRQHANNSNNPSR